MRLFSSCFPLSVFLYFSPILYWAAATQPKVSLNGDPLTTSFLNSTHVDGQLLDFTPLESIDPEFGLVPHFAGPKLLPVSCLLDAVDAALLLALGDFEGTITEEMVFKLDSHPQVEIALLPYDRPGSSIPWKYAVWALNFSINTMIRNRRYQCSVFFILRGSLVLGGLSYRVVLVALSEPGFMTSQSLVQGNDHNASLLKNPALKPNMSAIESTDTTNATANNPGLQVIFRLTGETLTLNAVFITCLDMLRELASFPSIGRMTADVTYVKSSKLFLEFHDPNDPPRTMMNPPYFQSEWLMRALAQMPDYMLEQRSFREAEIDISVDGIKIGMVSLSKKNPRVGVATA